MASLVATGIKQTSPGGKARAFCDIVGDQMGVLETAAYVNLAQTRVLAPESSKASRAPEDSNSQRRRSRK